jgi:Phage integrase family
VGWCARRGVDPMVPDMAIGCQWLDEEMSENPGHSGATFEGYRTALSETWSWYDAKMTLGEDKVVKKLIKAQKKKQPTSRSEETFDVRVLVPQLELTAPARTPRDIGAKLATAIMIETLARPSDMIRITFSSVKVAGNKVQMTTLQPKDQQTGNRKLEFNGMLATNITHWVKLWIEARTKLGANHKWLLSTTTKEPRQPAADTVANWVKTVMRAAGVEKRWTAYDVIKASLSYSVIVKNKPIAEATQSRWAKGSTVPARHYLRKKILPPSNTQNVTCLDSWGTSPEGYLRISERSDGYSTISEGRVDKRTDRLIEILFRAAPGSFEILSNLDL